MAKRIVDEEMRFSIIVNGDTAQKELYDLEKYTRDLTRRNKELRQEKVKMFAQGKKETDAYKRLTQEIKENNSILSLNKARMKELQNQIGITGLTMAQLKKKANELRLQLHNMVPESADFKRYQNDLKEVNAQLGKLRSQGRASQSSLSGIANGFNKYAALGASVIATLTGVVFSLQRVIDYNGKLADSMSDVRKTTGMTLEEVEDLAKGFGLLQTRTSRIKLLKIAEEGGRIGIAKDEIADFVAIMDKAVVALGDSFPGGAEETASKLGKLKLLFKETSDQGVDEAYNAIGSAINELGAQGVATEINIANFATRVGSLPDALKPTIADALALGAAFEENGIQAEIAGRAYSILLTQAAEESEKFAKVMGLTNEEVKKLINQDPLEFMIKFAKGLKGMNATDTAKTLQFLGVSADGANKVLGALSNNTDRFIDLMNLSNQSMAEGTSLIKEYNIKNNNFAAILDKIGKRFQGMLSSDMVNKFLEDVTMGFGRLIGAVKDADDEFEELSQQSYENARANRQLANSSQDLLDEYESLTADGVEPTAEAKMRLEEITLQLRDRLGESVFSIDKETGAFKLNTDAVKENIRLKRIAADEEASALISRMQGVIDRQEELKRRLSEQQRELAVRGRTAGVDPSGFYGSQRAVDTEINRRSLSLGGDPKKSAELEALRAYAAQLRKVGEIQRSVNNENRKGADLLVKLKELGYGLDDVNNFFKAPEAPGTGGPISGTFNQGGLPTDTPFNVPGGDQAKSKREKQRKSLLDFQRETEDARLDLISDSFKKEIEMQRVAHQRKIEDLQSQKVTEGKDAAEINAEINRQIGVQEELNTYKVATIYEKGVADRFKIIGDQYAQEKVLRQAAHNEQMAALGQDERAKEELKRQFDLEELKREEAHLKELLDKFNELREAGQFGGLDLSILTPEQVQQFNALADDLILKLSEIGVAKSALTGGGATGPGDTAAGSAQGAKDQFAANAASADLFGFTAEQWELTFDHLNTTEEKILAVQMAVGAVMNVWQQYGAMVQKMNDAEYRNFERLQDKKYRSLQTNLDRGLINQRQYDESVRGLEEETARKKAELEYKQAKSEKQQGIANAIIGTSVAIMQAYAQLGPIGGTIAAVLIGTLGALQINTIRKTPLPAKGYEQGYYGKVPIRRQQDGRIYNASYGGEPSTQLVDSPKYFLAGEGGKNFPEMIIDGKSFQRFNPDFKNTLYRELARVRGYESGYYQSKSTNAPEFNNESSSNEERMAMMGMIVKTNALLEDLQQNGIEAYLRRSYQNARDLREDIKDYERLKNKNKR